MKGFGDNFIPVIPTYNPLTHTPEYPFCPDPSCPCHEDQENIQMVNQQLQDGCIFLVRCHGCKQPAAHATHEKTKQEL